MKIWSGEVLRPVLHGVASGSHCDPFLKKGGRPCVWLEDETEMVDCQWCCSGAGHASRGWFENCEIQGLILDTASEHPQNIDFSHLNM
jgi:hypothetical protein